MRMNHSYPERFMSFASYGDAARTGKGVVRPPPCLLCSDGEAEQQRGSLIKHKKERQRPVTHCKRGHEEYKESSKIKKGLVFIRPYFSEVRRNKWLEERSGLRWVGYHSRNREKALLLVDVLPRSHQCDQSL